MAQNNPIADAFKAFENQTSVVDFSEAFSVAKRNAEAAQEAFQLWVESSQQIISLSNKAAEQTAKQTLELFNAIASSKDPQESINKQAEYAQSVIEGAAANAKEITALATKASDKTSDLFKAQANKNIKDAAKAASAAASNAKSTAKKAAAA